MKRFLYIAIVIVTVGLLGGCGMSTPSYTEVRSETLDALQVVSDLVPGPKEIVATPEFDPYPCNDGLTLSGGSGSFYTGQWALFVDDSFDIPRFIEEVPQLLGDEWHVEELGVPVNFAEVYLVRDSPRMTLTVEENTIDGRKAIDLLAISRCGRVTDEERSATFPPPTPEPAP